MKRILSIGTIALISASLCCGRSVAQVSKAEIPVLSDHDYLEIDQLYATYMHDYATASNNGKDFADLFTEDGIHVCGSCSVGSFTYYYGPGALASWATGALFLGRQAAVPAGDGALIRTVLPNGGKNLRNVDHVISNTVIEAVPGGAISWSYLLSLNDVGGSIGESRTTAVGSYFDYLVKTNKGWKFKHKIFVFSGNPVPAGIPPAFRGSTLGALLDTTVLSNPNLNDPG